ncbi:hypothetical protein DSM43518_02021 [Mycobacterium marinum]|uniref:hypothetical protein n=1 Tax=Mycobacterium marinum TaxID=1781 RepID=UPI000CD82B25|nr:hypothetical protein [Mycobacterium marinum]AXN50934.1 hypothetical protein CCUG20998_03532 [Mycobacterium marinum]RFZ11181.1 hypothetical protein DSM43518_02021 [Mycobacterium marinum]RFZ25468.1 hypothetical protein DSM43519_01654 [Mycobacterium marinum]RFZ28355.1 hypothetical protein DSM44344_01400 [Mycobacterium marinum]RFZ33818.1 hypothetical protein NCTC2275_02664 [Mycobacterium marinum]
MSSYELLELFGADVIEDPDDETKLVIRVDWPPEDGALATALRCGERSELRQMVAQCANELAVLRAAKVPEAQADEYESRLFLSTAKYREQADDHRRRSVPNNEPGSLYSTWNK